GIHATSSLSAGKQATAQGKFVVLPITLTNRLGLAQSFDRSGTQQAGLVLEGTVYKEDTGVEQGSDPSSCLNHTTPLPSGKSETCDVIFDVPVGAAAKLGKHGSGDLYVVDFGSDLASSTPGQM